PRGTESPLLSVIDDQLGEQGACIFGNAYWNGGAIPLNGRHVVNISLPKHGIMRETFGLHNNCTVAGYIYMGPPEHRHSGGCAMNEAALCRNSYGSFAPINYSGLVALSMSLKSIALLAQL